MMKFHKRSMLIGLLTATVLVVGACGGDDEEEGDARKGTTTTQAGAPAGEAPSGEKTTVHAIDIGFQPKEISAPAGATLEMVNDGSIRHTLLIEGEPKFHLEVTKKGTADSAPLDLDPGDYTFYCDVPGHRSAGMQGSLTVQ